MNKAGILALFAPILLSVLRGYAQTTPPQTTPVTNTETPTIVANADEVTLDLVVHGKKNKPVLDLRPEDIVVTDNGSAVKLSGLRLVTGAPSAEHSLTLVFDRLDPSSATNAREIAAKILKMVPANGFSFSVLNVGGRLRLFQEFTTDRVAVGKAIDAASERDEGTKGDLAAQPEKDLIAVAQTGRDSSGTRVVAKQRNAARIMLASLQESQRIVQDQQVFAQSSKAVFAWKNAATLGDGSGALQVLSYRVAHENATIDLSQGNDTIGVGFHGLIYIDGATNGIRRVTLEADGLPRSFSMHAASMTVDYDYVSISGRDYLLPVRSTVSLRRHRKQVELNEIAFRNYRRFASRTKIKMIQ